MPVHPLFQFLKGVKIPKLSGYFTDNIPVFRSAATSSTTSSMYLTRVTSTSFTSTDGVWTLSVAARALFETGNEKSTGAIPAPAAKAAPTTPIPATVLLLY
jgi:hypothetical protein